MQFKYLKYDLYRYFYPNDKVSHISLSEKIKAVLFTQGIWATMVYRLRRWVEYECNNAVVSSIIKPIGRILQIIIEIITGISIAPEVDIGPGLYIGHFGNIFIAGTTKIGKIVNISQEVTIGYAGRGEKWGHPKEIGDFVYLAPGAKIIGNISIGNNAAVGANSVLTKSIPDNAVVMGVPARIMNYNSSKDFIVYNHKMNNDIL